MAINRTSFAKALYPGVNAWYGEAYNEFKTEYTDLFDTERSSRAYEEDVLKSGFGLAQQKPEGQGVAYDEERQGFVTRYSHVTYALGFIITREMKADDLYAIVGKQRAQGLAFSMRQTKEIVGANVYNRAFDSNYTGGDGVSLLNSAHPNYAGGTWSNTLSVAADLSEASLEEACIDIMKYTNDRGLRISVMPECLIISPDQVFEAERIMKSQHRVGTGNNDINALNAMGKFPGGIKVNHYLTDPDAWFIRTNVQNGLKHFVREDMSFSVDNDFDTENAKYKAMERYSFGWTDPRALYGSPGA